MTGSAANRRLPVEAGGVTSERVRLKLVDGQARAVTYLRLSLTDRCNYRCLYCMPEHGVAVTPKSEQLTAAEIVRLVASLQPLGLERVRLTGGEPTIRPDLLAIVSGLAALGLRELTMTTNGELLEGLAPSLHAAGLSRLNVSLDSLDEARFRRITRRGNLTRVLAGLAAARAAGFSRTKLNSVVLGGQNDDELPAICAFSWAQGIVPTFIEEMPMADGALDFARGGFVSAATMRARVIAAFGPLLPDEDQPIGAGPARYLRTSTGERVGFISAVTEPFCATCNRIRITSTGRLHACLSSDDQVNLLDDLRSGRRDATEVLVERVRTALSNKVVSHHFTTCGAGAPKKHMVTIGG